MKNIQTMKRRIDTEPDGKPDDKRKEQKKYGFIYNIKL